MATQLTGMNGPAARGLWWWIARATSSLPVPLSPVMSTLVLPNCCSRPMSSRMRRRCGLSPTKPDKSPALRLAGGQRGQPLIGLFAGVLGFAAKGDLGFQLGVALLQFAGEAAEFEMGGDPRDHLLGLERFFDVIDRAQPEAAHARIPSRRGW